MAASNLNLGKASGGVLNIQPADGTTTTSIVLPASGTVVATDVAVTDNAIARYDGTTGKVKNSAITIDNSGNIGSGTQTFNGFGGSGFKNYIINGGFDVWQRGFVINNVQNTNYTADMWVHTRNGSGATVNIQQGSWIPGSIETGVGTTSHNILEFIQTAAGTGCSFNTINHRIEDVQWSSQKTLTLSFNCEFLSAADILPLIMVRQNFGTGGSASVDTVIATNIPVSSNSWDKKSFTFTLPSISGKTVGTSPYTEIIIFLPVNKVQRFRLNNVQLESGSIATPFEQRPYGLELSLCQRYLPSFTAFAGTGTVRSSTAAAITIPFEVVPRVPPTGMIVSGYGNIENGGTWTQMVGTFSTASITSANTLWTNGAATMIIGQGSQLNLGTNTILFTGCEL